jgi:cytochrome c oxidase cbb3-type subunit III
VKLVPLLALVTALAAPGQVPVRNPHSSAEDRAAGAKIFRSHCAQCHGLKGTGGLGPDLTTGTFLHGSTDADLYRTISEGIVGTAMPGVFFDGTQVWQIVAHVRSLSQSGSAAKVHGDAVHGSRMFREKGCSGCHLVRGEGSVKGPDLSVIGSQRSPEYLRDSIVDPNAKVAPQYWVAKIVARDGTSHTGFLMNQDTYMVQLLDFSRGLEALPRTSLRDFGVDRSSAMPSYKGKLSEDELNDVVSYLASLKEKPE